MGATHLRALRALAALARGGPPGGGWLRARARIRGTSLLVDLPLHPVDGVHQLGDDVLRPARGLERQDVRPHLPGGRGQRTQP